jgi:hypothetical protein
VQSCRLIPIVLPPGSYSQHSVTSQKLLSVCPPYVSIIFSFMLSLPRVLYVLLLSLLSSLCVVSSINFYFPSSFSATSASFNLRFLPYPLRHCLTQWSPTWGTRTSRGTSRYLISIKTKHRNRLNLEPALILALTKIRTRTEVLACQKQAQSSH